MTEATPVLRQIRSFVLRQGRLTQGQHLALERYWPQFGVEKPTAPLDFSALFGNTNPVFLEIGFGNGESLATIAARHPEHNYLGVEVHTPGVGHLLLKLAETGCSNVRVARMDAIEMLRQAIPANSLSGVFLFFPDPWPKQRHHKRRIVQPAFLELVLRALKPGGTLHMATDWQHYAVHMLRICTGQPGLHNLAGDGCYSPRPEERPETKFERRGARLGHGVWDLIFRKAH